jgi:hypothetical protein
VGKIVPENPHLAAVRPKQTEHVLEDHTFPLTARPDNYRGGSGRDLQINPVQHNLGAKGFTYILKLDYTLSILLQN